MTKKEFWETLRSVSEERGFKLLQDGQVRQKRTCECPVTAVARECTGERFGASKYLEAAAVISLPDNLMLDILDAADFTSDRLSPRIQKVRKKLLKTLNLKEVA